MIRRLAGIGLLAGIATLAGDVQAATFTVTKTADTADGTCDADCSLREAIVAANANAGADDVSVPGGVYVLSLGELDITDDLTVTGAAPVGSTVIDGNASSRVIDVDISGIPLIVDLVNLFIINGNSGQGGCIRNFETLTLTDSFVSGCTGSGIFNARTLTITGTILGLAGVDQCSSSGIRNNGGTATLNNVMVVLNTDALTGGGGIFNSGNLTVNNSFFAQNTTLLVFDGAGIVQTGSFSILTITGSTFRDHVAFGPAVIELLDGTGTIANTTISGNERGIGVGASASLAVLDSTISGNSVGGIASQGRVGVSHSTITGNGTGVSNAVSLSHTIVAGNTTNCQGSEVLSLGHNLDDDGTCPFTAPGDLSNVPDAGLGPLADHGGPTETHSLLPGSPAIDAGRGTDQRGESLFDGDGDMVIVADVGAYEFLPEVSLGSSLLSGTALLAFLARRRRHRNT